MKGAYNTSKKLTNKIDKNIELVELCKAVMLITPHKTHKQILNAIDLPIDKWKYVLEILREEKMGGLPTVLKLLESISKLLKENKE